MGCGCGKKGSSPRRNKKTLMPTVGPKSIRTTGATPSDIRAMGMAGSTGVGQAKKMDEQRKRIEKLKRDAVRKKLGK